MDIQQIHNALALQWSAEPKNRRDVPRSLSLDSEILKPEISVITGVRRCGKSSFLKQIQAKYQKLYAVLLVEFDDPNLDNFSGKDLSSLISFWEAKTDPGAKRRLYLFDEIQNVKEWEKWIPHLAKNQNTKIVITGSNAKLLSSELATLLTGRHLTHEMTPLSFQEIVQIENPTTEKEDLTDLQKISSYALYAKFGGFPRSYIDSDPAILPRYMADILERDIIARHGARLARQLKELTRFICSNNTCLINRKRVARELGIKDDGTIKRYCNWLEESYLFYEIKGFSVSVRKQLRSSPKFYCVDPMLAQASAFSMMSGEGRFLENAVFLELKRRGYEIHYWKAEKQEAEVDFIARKPGEDPLAVQVSLTVIDEQTFAREVRGLVAINQELGVSRLMIVTKNDVSRKLKIENVDIEVVSFLDWGLN